MQLLEVAVFPMLAAEVAGGLRCCLGGGGEMGEGAPRTLDELGMLEPSGGGDDHRLRPVMAAHVAADGVPAQGGDDLGGAQHRPPHRLAGKGGGLKMVEDDVVGRVLGLADLLQDHLTLALELGRLEGRVLQDVGQDIEAEAEIRAQYFGVIGGLLAAGIGVEMPADGLDLLGDALRRAALGQGVAGDREPVREPGDVDGHAAPLSRTRPATKSSTAARSFGSTLMRSGR